MGVYIVGMHRSGTSALAAMTSALCGLPASKLATESNPAGQWERAELRPALDLLLAWNRATWAHPPSEGQELACPPILQSYRQRVFDAHCGEPFLWKDPRLCLTIDTWLAMIQPTPTVVFVHREPMAVAESLRRRNGWSLERGLALWERTNRNAIVRLGGRSVVAVPHRRLRSEPEAVAELIVDGVEIRADNTSVGMAVDAATAQQPVEADNGRADRPIETDGGAECTEAQLRLAERLSAANGPCTLDLDGIGPESPTTSVALGRAPIAELATTAFRALRAAPRRHDNQVAGPNDESSYEPNDDR